MDPQSEAERSGCGGCLGGLFQIVLICIIGGAVLGIMAATALGLGTIIVSVLAALFAAIFH